MVLDPAQTSSEEYRELRATIRERGTARLFVMTITLVAWAGLALAIKALFFAPVLMLVPLLLLATGFELGYACTSELRGSAGICRSFTNRLLRRTGSTS
jgi:hypothetical protein